MRIPIENSKEIEIGCIKNVPFGEIENIASGSFLRNTETTGYNIKTGEFHLKGYIPTALALRITEELIPQEVFDDPERKVSVYKKFFGLGRPQYNVLWPDSSTKLSYYSWN